MAVHQSSARPFADVRHLGVVVRAVDGIDPNEPFGLHSGFLYKLDGAEPRFNHLAWHFDLRDEPASDDRYLWADTGLDEGNSRVMAAWLANRGAHPNNIPYGIDAQGVCFDKETQQFVPPPIGKGLTCATYIKAVFSHLGFIILDEGTWPPDRPEDRSWQIAVVEALRRDGAGEDYVTAVTNDVGAKRFRPAEVVGAATLPAVSWPAAFEDVAVVAASIIVDVQASRAAAPVPTDTDEDAPVPGPSPADKGE
jgi:hypothetical protein